MVVVWLITLVAGIVIAAGASRRAVGDVNVGNATGSALTQVTLITLSDHGDRRLIVPVGGVTVLATLVIAVVIRDGELSQIDGAVLVGIWAASMAAVSRWHRTDGAADPIDRAVRPRDVVRVLGWLALVGLAATAVVRAFVELADTFGVPELVASTIVLARSMAAIIGLAS